MIFLQPTYCHGWDEISTIVVANRSVVFYKYSKINFDEINLFYVFFIFNKSLNYFTILKYSIINFTGNVAVSITEEDNFAIFFYMNRDLDWNRNHQLVRFVFTPFPCNQGKWQFYRKKRHHRLGLKWIMPQMARPFNISLLVPIIIFHILDLGLVAIHR